MRNEGRLNAKGEDLGERVLASGVFTRIKEHRLKPVPLAGVLASGIAFERGSK